MARYTAKDAVGERFGRLLVTAAIPRVPKCRKGTRVKALCDCGQTGVFAFSQLVSGHTISCGCAHKQAMRQLLTTHGLSKTKQYRVWSAMRGRCENPMDRAWHYYGARGIKVCARWRKSFAAFLADMGPRPFARAQLDRIDNNKGYSQRNCRWVTAKENCNNRRARGTCG